MSCFYTSPVFRRLYRKQHQPPLWHIWRILFQDNTVSYTHLDVYKRQVLHKAQECGAESGTILLGEGTVESKFWEKIGLAEIHKEILVVPASDELSDKLHDTISEAFTFSKSNHGVAFTIPVSYTHLIRDCAFCKKFLHSRQVDRPNEEKQCF